MVTGPAPPARGTTAVMGHTRRCLAATQKPRRFQGIRGVWSGHKHGSKARTQRAVLESNTARALISSGLGVRSPSRHRGSDLFSSHSVPCPLPAFSFLGVPPSPPGSLTPLSSSSTLPHLPSCRSLSRPFPEPQPCWSPQLARRPQTAHAVLAKAEGRQWLCAKLQLGRDGPGKGLI